MGNPEEIIPDPLVVRANLVIESMNRIGEAFKGFTIEVDMYTPEMQDNPIMVAIVSDAAEAFQILGIAVGVYFGTEVDWSDAIGNQYDSPI